MRINPAAHCALLMGLATLSAAPAAGELYPSRPITLVVPFPAGGPTDTIARVLAEPMRGSLGQPIVIENITGAGGTIGVGRVAKAGPDGYTLCLGIWPTHVLAGAIYTLSYDVQKDFEPIGLIANNPQVIVANKSVLARELSELVNWARTRLGKATVGTAGTSSSQHVSGVLFEKLTGASLQFVPYRGAAPAIQDLIAGHIDLMFDQASSALPYVRTGVLKAYAVASTVRLQSAPAIPTAEEAGLANFNISVWAGLWAPRSTSRDIVAKLNGALVDAIRDPKVRARLEELGQELPPRKEQTPQALRQLQQAEIAKWWPIVKAAGIRAD